MLPTKLKIQIISNPAMRFLVIDLRETCPHMNKEMCARMLRVVYNEKKKKKENIDVPF